MLHGGSDVVIIGRKTLKKKLRIDVMAQLEASVLKVHAFQDDAGMEFAALAVGEPNDGAVLQVVMAVTTFGPGCDASRDVEDEVTLMLLSQRTMVFQDSEVDVHHRVRALETAVEEAVGHGVPPEGAKMLHDIVFCTHFDIFGRSLLGDPPSRVKTMTVRLQPSAKAMRAKPRASPPAKAAWLLEHMVSLETVGMVFRNPQKIHASVATAIPKGSNFCRMVTRLGCTNTWPTWKQPAWWFGTRRRSTQA